jgi:hypothetical protein
MILFTDLCLLYFVFVFLTPACFLRGNLWDKVPSPAVVDANETVIVGISPITANNLVLIIGYYRGRLCRHHTEAAHVMDNRSVTYRNPQPLINTDVSHVDFNRRQWSPTMAPNAKCVGRSREAWLGRGAIQDLRKSRDKFPLLYRILHDKISGYHR